MIAIEFGRKYCALSSDWAIAPAKRAGIEAALQALKPRLLKSSLDGFIRWGSGTLLGFSDFTISSPKSFNPFFNSLKLKPDKPIRYCTALQADNTSFFKHFGQASNKSDIALAKSAECLLYSLFVGDLPPWSDLSFLFSLPHRRSIYSLLDFKAESCLLPSRIYPGYETGLRHPKRSGLLPARGDHWSIPSH